MQDFNRAFGSLIRKLREAHGLSQQELAQMVSLSRVSIANIEGGHQSVTLRHALEFCFRLKLPIAKIQNLYDQVMLECELDEHGHDIQQDLRRLEIFNVSTV